MVIYFNGRRRTRNDIIRYIINILQFSVVICMFFTFSLIQSNVPKTEPSHKNNKNMRHITFNVYISEKPENSREGSSTLNSRIGHYFIKNEMIKRCPKTQLQDDDYLSIPAFIFEGVYGKPSDFNKTEEEQPFQEETDDPIADYFNLLKKTTGFCRKLVRFGGGPICRYRNDTLQPVVLDGNKIICLEQTFQVATSTNITHPDCLVLSFGIRLDTSFDEDIREANCEVHMFDPDKYTNYPATEDPLIHFHKYGLWPNNEIIYVKNRNKTMEMYSLDGIITRLNLTKRLINVLKIDIEAIEWKVLSKLLEESLLDIVGQIAIEVHAGEQPKIEVNDDKYRRYRKILLDLESQGFDRVSYWDNVQPKYEKFDKKGNHHAYAGELLLTNRKWYHKSFREEAIKFGYNFNPKF